MKFLTQLSDNNLVEKFSPAKWLKRQALRLNPTIPLLAIVLALNGLNAAAATAHVTTRGSIFDPLEVTISAGDTVQWDQNDITEHTVTSLDNLFDSGDMEPDETFSYTFSTPGTYGYYCVIHGYGMSGTIIVSDAAPNTPPAKPSNVSPANNATNQPVAIQLQSTAFSDSDGDTQAASEWLVFSNGVQIVDSGEVSVGSLTSYSPAGLSEGTGYDWQVRYKDSRGAWSDYSTTTHFTTLVTVAAPPALLAPGGFTNGNWMLKGIGGASKNFTVLATTNLFQWTNIGTATSDVSGGFIFIDSNSFQFKSRFYRTTN